jgi:hypothetical protein
MKTIYDKQKQEHIIFFKAFMEAKKIIDECSERNYLESQTIKRDENNIYSYKKMPSLSLEYARAIKYYNNLEFNKYPKNELFDTIIKKHRENNPIYNDVIDILIKDSLKLIDVNEFKSYLDCKEFFDFVACLSLIIDEKEKKEFNDYHSLIKHYYENFNYIRKNNKNAPTKAEINSKDIKDYFDLDSFTFKGNFINKRYNDFFYETLEKISNTKINRKSLSKNILQNILEDIESINLKIDNQENMRIFKDLSNKAIEEKPRAINLR